MMFELLFINSGVFNHWILIEVQLTLKVKQTPYNDQEHCCEL